MNDLRDHANEIGSKRPGFGGLRYQGKINIVEEVTTF